MRSYIRVFAACIALGFCDAAGAQGQHPEPAPTTRAARLPPISLNVKDARLKDVAKALGEATGTTITAPTATELGRAPQPNWDANHYTLNVNGQPFWEVFRQLTEQHAIRLIMPRKPDDDGKFPELVLMPAPSGPGSLSRLPKFVTGGDYWLQMSGIGRNDTGHYIALSWAVIADPRLHMHIEHAEFPPLTHIIDDRGDEMKYVQPQGVASTAALPRGSLWPVHANLQLPTNGATKIVSLQGSFSMYELLENGAGDTRLVTIPFEIRDIPLPSQP